MITVDLSYTVGIRTHERISVYLDTDMLAELAKGDSGRRERFVRVIRRRGVLLYSEANLSETGELELESRTGSLVLDLLESLGRYWAPLTMDPVRVMDLEAAGEFGRQPFSERVLRDFLNRRFQEQKEIDVRIDRLSSDELTDLLCDLSLAVRHTGDTSGARRQMKARMDVQLRQILDKAHKAYKEAPGAYDARIAAMRFDPQGARCTYVAGHLIHMLVREYKARPLGRNDGMDFFHAAMSLSFARVVALDKSWRDRALRIPGLDRFVDVFYRPEADAMVDHLEAMAAALEAEIAESTIEGGE